MLSNTDYGKNILARVKRLSEIHKQSDIKRLMSTTFPGTHCPLMGVLMSVRQMQDFCTVIVGTDECTYYSKMLSYMPVFKHMQERIFSVVLNDYDITFGSVSKVKKAFADLCAEEKPKCIVLVTTCLLEIIGDDYETLVDELENKYEVPILLVHTEHFQCKDHLPGIERTLAATIKMMQKQETKNIVNILGDADIDVEKSELGCFLQNADVSIGLQLPGNCNIAALKEAANARLNIVVNSTGLALAEKMQAKFALPFVYFPPLGNPLDVLLAYNKLEEILQTEIPQEIINNKEKCLALEAQVKASLQGVSYIYGNSAYPCLEVNTYLASLGLVPLLIQLTYWHKNNEADKKNLLRYADPYICQSANLAAMEYVYQVLAPQIYIGREFTDRLRRRGIAEIDSLNNKDKLGFAGCLNLLQGLLYADIKNAGEVKTL